MAMGYLEPVDVRPLMRRSARFHSQYPAVVEAGVDGAESRRLTYEEAWTRGLRLANGLLALGLEPGDRIGVLEDNTLESVDVNAVAGLIDEVESLQHIMVRDDGYEDWLAGFPADDPDPEVAEDDWFIIRHTGGTTGLSKGVGYSHKTWLNAGRDWFYNFPPVELGDVCQHAGPISHGSGP
jgi:acyl-CoA synthetase (AMP-forming)/AMP-acid ligase II